MAPGTRVDFHSRLIAWLRVLLPLFALALLSTLFLFSQAIDPEQAIPYADVDVADRLAQPRMVGAGFSGVTSSGAAITVTSDQAVPGDQGLLTATTVSAAIDLPKGNSLSVTAANAQIDSTNLTADLSGGVMLKSSNGYQLQTPGLALSSENRLAESRGPVQGTGPLGTLSADHMLLTTADPDPDRFVLVFKGQVRMLYLPPKE